MNPPPPTLAAWLLQHFTPAAHREELAGDLLESFHEGRSSAWFWRQVLLAILAGPSRALCARWPQICFAFAGTALLSWHPWIARNPSVQHLERWGIGLPWPVSGIYQAGLAELLRVPLLLPILALLLLLTGSFGWSRVARALFTSLVLLAIADLALSWWISTHRGNSDLHGWICLILQEARFFFPLLIAARTARPSATLSVWAPRP